MKSRREEGEEGGEEGEISQMGWEEHENLYDSHVVDSKYGMESTRVKKRRRVSSTSGIPP